jgi:hypothetical protein
MSAARAVQTSARSPRLRTQCGACAQQHSEPVGLCKRCSAAWRRRRRRRHRVHTACVIASQASEDPAGLGPCGWASRPLAPIRHAGMAVHGPRRSPAWLRSGPALVAALGPQDRDMETDGSDASPPHRSGGGASRSGGGARGRSEEVRHGDGHGDGLVESSPLIQLVESSPLLSYEGCMRRGE